MDPRDRVALVTGGARIGRTVAEELARRGCHVALTYRGSQKSAEETAAAVRALGRRAIAVPVDLQSAAGAERAVDGVTREIGVPDILICMASLYEKTPFAGLDEEAWSSNLDVNLKSI